MSLDPKDLPDTRPETPGAMALKSARTPAEVAADQRLFAMLKAPVWRAFTFETGSFLLHVPSSHILEVPIELARHVRGDDVAFGADEELDALAATLPMPPPRDVKTDVRAISLNMAQGCNLRCVYCFAGEGDYGKKAMMSLATAKAAIELFTAGKDWFHVTFFGGEPLLNFAVMKEVVAWCTILPIRFTYSVTTNGTLLNDEKLAWLKEHKVRVTISYDGHGLQARQRLNKDKETNSEQLVERKLKAFEEQLGALQSLVLRSTVTRKNLDILEESILSTLTSHHYRLAVHHHATAFKTQQFGPDDVRQLNEIYTRVIDRLLAKEDFDGLLRLENVKKHVASLESGKTSGKACGAGVNYLTVSAEGAFYLCHRFNEDESENFGDIRRGLDPVKLEEVRKFRGAALDPCRSCWMREWCAGGCLHENKAATGSTFDIDAVFCSMQDVEITQAMRVLSILREKAPERVPGLLPNPKAPNFDGARS